MDLLRAKDCAKRFGLTRKTWYTWQREDPVSPKPAIKTSAYVAWREEDVEAYKELLIAQNRSGSGGKGKEAA